jgi:hypothetical protein
MLIVLQIHHENCLKTMRDACNGSMAKMRRQSHQTTHAMRRERDEHKARPPTLKDYGVFNYQSRLRGIGLQLTCDHGIAPAYAFSFDMARRSCKS